MFLLLTVLISFTFILLGVNYQVRQMIKTSKIFVAIGFLFSIISLLIGSYAVYHDCRYYPRFQDYERVISMCKLDSLFFTGMWTLILAALYSFLKGNNRWVKIILGGGFVLAIVSAAVDLGVLR